MASTEQTGCGRNAGDYVSAFCVDFGKPGKIAVYIPAGSFCFFLCFISIFVSDNKISSQGDRIFA